MSRTLFHEFDSHENYLIGKFHGHEFFRSFEAQTDEQLKHFLLQKRHVSENFVSWYTSALGIVRDQDAKGIIVKIIGEEIPCDAPAHREDLVEDLKFIGLSMSDIYSSAPTQATKEAIEKLNYIVRESDDTYNDIRIMAGLRVAGEVLVAEEYRHVVQELGKRFGMTAENSRFYWPHLRHDVKDRAKNNGSTHASSFEKFLSKKINYNSLDASINGTDEGYRARMSIYDQFVH